MSETRLGKVCHRGHDDGTNHSIRYVRGGNCVECMRTRDKSERRIESRKTKFGMTHDDLVRMYDHQKGRCRWCGKQWGHMHEYDVKVDHSYQSGKVRGLLCNGCNVKLGYIEKYLFNVDGRKQWVNKYILEGLDVDGR